MLTGADCSDHIHEVPPSLGELMFTGPFEAIPESFSGFEPFFDLISKRFCFAPFHCRLSIWSDALGELAQEAHVVLEKDLDVVDAVLEHGQAVDADAESEAADFLGVVIHKA